MTKKTRLLLLGGVLAVSVGAAAAMSLSKEAREDIGRAERWSLSCLPTR